jgi:glucose/arabinose dehydrogenase
MMLNSIPDLFPIHFRSWENVLFKSIMRACVVLLLTNAAEGSERVDGIDTNSIEKPISKGAIVVDSQPFLQMPRTRDVSKPSDYDEDGNPQYGTNSAHARIQYMVPVPDKSGRLIVSDIRGLLYQINADGSGLTTYLDLRTAVDDLAEHVYPNEAGLMGFAFHPDFAIAGSPGFGKLYIGYSSTKDSGIPKYLSDDAGSHHSVIREWSVNPQSNFADGSSRELIRIGQFSLGHNIGTLAFNSAATKEDADYGMLYFSLGDGGMAFDTRAHGQNKATPLAAMLRINPLAVGDLPYTIPTDNPFVNDKTAIPELWAYGLRHAQHFSFDSQGTMYINDIGQNQVEEVNIGVLGGNFGWNVREGAFLTGAGVEGGYLPYLYPLKNQNDGFIYPAVQYDHDDFTNAIGSGYVYEGTAIPELTGKYVFADLVLGRIFYVDAVSLENGKPQHPFELRIRFAGVERPVIEEVGYENTYAPIQRADLRLAIGTDKELYMLTKGDGQIRKLVPVY